MRRKNRKIQSILLISLPYVCLYWAHFPPIFRISSFSILLVDGRFEFFLPLGEGEGRVRGAGTGGVDFLLTIPGGGGVSRRGGAGRGLGVWLPRIGEFGKGGG